MLNWTNINTKGNNAIIARLSQAQLDDNTTRGNTPGLTDPNDHDSERIEHPDGEDGDDEAYESDEDYSYEDEVEYEDEEEVESEDEDEDDDVTAHRDQGAGERGEPSSTATERSEEEEAAADPSNFANYTGPHRRHGSVSQDIECLLVSAANSSSIGLGLRQVSSRRIEGLFGIFKKEEKKETTYNSKAPALPTLPQERRDQILLEACSNRTLKILTLLTLDAL